MPITPARRRALAAAATASAGISLFVAAPAHATGPAADVWVSNNCAMYPSACDGTAMNAGVILFFHSLTTADGYPKGSYARLYGDVYDYAYDTVEVNTRVIRYHYQFLPNSGDGSGVAVKNNAAAANSCSFTARETYRIYYNSGYAGHSQEILPGYYCDNGTVNLDSTLKNENASQHWA